MSTRLLVALKSVQEAREAAQRRRTRDREFKAFCSGGTMVFAGLLLAAVYALLTHQISN
jgi:hypothetical protein